MSESGYGENNNIDKVSSLEDVIPSDGVAGRIGKGKAADTS